MKMLWMRLRHYSGGKNLRVGDLYKTAFSNFLLTNKIPKVVPKITRTQREIVMDDETVEMLDSIRKIALKRNQPLAVVIEEALQSYLDLPENYLGKDLQKSGHVERIV